MLHDTRQSSSLSTSCNVSLCNLSTPRNFWWLGKLFSSCWSAWFKSFAAFLAFRMKLSCYETSWRFHYRFFFNLKKWSPLSNFTPRSVKLFLSACQFQMDALSWLLEYFGKCEKKIYLLFFSHTVSRTSKLENTFIRIFKEVCGIKLTKCEK